MSNESRLPEWSIQEMDVYRGLDHPTTTIPESTTCFSSRPPLMATFPRSVGKGDPDRVGDPTSCMGIKDSGLLQGTGCFV